MIVLLFTNTQFGRYIELVKTISPQCHFCYFSDGNLLNEIVMRTRTHAIIKMQIYVDNEKVLQFLVGANFLL